MSAWPLKPDLIASYAYMKNVFTPEECKLIIDIGLKKELINATVNATNQQYKPDLRKNKISWVEAEDGLEFMYRKLTDVTLALNAEFFGFDLYGITEKIQFSVYEHIGDGFKLHFDKTYGSVIRKLSLVVQLSDPSEYRGCELKVYTGSIPEVVPKDQGTVIAFPGYVMHEVTPLISGKRYTLVAWLGGPNFK
jgi:PKHD-type hydroxylase